MTQEASIPELTQGQHPLRRNIEIKARAENHPGLCARAGKMGAKFAGVLVQADTYFHIPRGRLKLRQIEPDRCELIYYHRPDAREAKPSDYWLVPLEPSTGEHLMALLTAAFGTRAIVKKRRELWLWENVRIHIDAVEKLGDFVELEAVVGPQFDEARSHANVRRVIAALGIAPDDHVAASYVDLITGPTTGGQP